MNFNRKFGINVACLTGNDDVDSLKKIKNAGFESVFCKTHEVKKICELKNQCEKIGLDLDFLHAPYNDINAFWIKDSDYKKLQNEIYSSIDGAEKAGVKTVVCHASKGWFPPEISDVGFDRFDALTDYAQKKGVIIAFENLRNFKTLSAIMNRYKNNDNVKFCYDCGHEHCYTEEIDYLDLYGDRLICTHIHDNFGRNPVDKLADNDEHLLPFDGNIDFLKIINRLNVLGYKGALTLELKKNDRYAMSDEQYLKEAYFRIKKISDIR